MFDSLHGWVASTPTPWVGGSSVLRLATRRSSTLMFFLLHLVYLPSNALGQERETSRAGLAGTVMDAQGRAISGVSVRIPVLRLSVLTGSDGRFLLRNLPPRTLQVSFQGIGFGTRQEEVELRGGETTTMLITLDPAPVPLRELVVTGTPGVRSAMETPQSVSAVGEEDLSAYRSASLGDLLTRTVPGAASIQTGSQVGIPVLRGLSGTRVRVLQDGVGQEFYQYGVRHHPTTSLFEAQRVEVVRGPSSILYGSDALGGAVNILTKDVPSTQEGETLVGGEVATQYFSNNGEMAGHLDLHAARSGFGFRGGMEIRDGDDASAPDAPDFFETTAAGSAKTGRYGDPKYTGVLPHTAFRQWSAYAQAGFRGQSRSGGVLLTHWDNENNFLLPPGGPKGSETNPPLGLGLHLAQTNLSLKGDVVLDQVTLRPTFSYQRAVRQASAPGNLIQNDPDFPVDLTKDVFTGRLEMAHGALKGLEGTLGVEWSLQDGESLGPVELEPGARVSNLGIFAFEEKQTGPWILSAGGRLDRRSMEADPNSLTRDQGLLEQDHVVASGSLGAAYRLNSGVTFTSQIGTGFRAPTVFELFADGEHGGVAAYQRGDPTLDPERALNLEASMRWARQGFSGELTGYWNRIDNYIYLKNTGTETASGLAIYEADQTKATLKGLEGNLEASLLQWVSLGGHFSWVEGVGDDLDDPAGGVGDGTLPLLPPTQLGAFLELRNATKSVFRGSSLRLSVSRALEKDAAGVLEPFSQFDRIPFGTASTEGFTLVGLEARTTVQMGPTPILVSFTVDNLMDEVYRSFLDTYKGYALSPGRNIGLRLSAPLRFSR